MDASDIERALLREYGIRVQPQMSQYVLSRLRAAARGPAFGELPVIGGDARTGVPIRALVALDRLSSAAASPSEAHAGADAGAVAADAKGTAGGESSSA